jgi:hypothetical protein
MGGVAQQPGTASAVQELAGDLLPQTPALARGMADHLYAAIPELSATQDDELRAVLLDSTAANIGQILRLMAHGASTDDVVVPHEALEYLRGNVRRGTPLAALLRSYRLGHGWRWERWSRGAPGARRGLRGAGGRAGSELGVHVRLRRPGVRRARRGVRHRARAHDARGGPAAAETARAILAGERVDEEAASRRLGYEVRRHHVAVRVTGSGTEISGVERAVGEAAAALGTKDPLVVASGLTRFDVWCGPSPLRRRTRSSATSLRLGCSSPSGRRARASPASAARTPRRSRPPAWSSSS